MALAVLAILASTEKTCTVASMPLFDVRAQLTIRATDEGEARERAARWDAFELTEGIRLTLDDGLPIEIESEAHDLSW
jgi:hypothetical protein